MIKTLNRIEICDLILAEIRVCIPKFASDDISFDKGFLEMGIESLQAVNIVDGLAQKLIIPLDVTALFDKPNLNALTDYILETLVAREMKASLSSDQNTKLSKTIFEVKDLTPTQKPLAIIGMSGRFPGADTIQDYFSLLSNGVCAVKKQNHNRWPSNPDDSINFFGAINGFEMFAADVFGISDLEAKAMDPQQRLLLEEVWNALEDAGISPLSVRGSETGVYIGISSHDYSYKIDSVAQKNIFSITGNSQSIAANRISYFFDLKGPSLAIDTACSSSLVALDSAVKALQNKEINMAIVGGVNLLLKSDLSQAFKDATMLAPDGLCKTFSADANGYVRGEGVGIVILKRKSDASNSNYRIYADVLSVAVNQDGKSSSLTAPNGSAQEKVILQALRRAQLNSNDIVFHEAHGTGTSVGDPIEGLALERVHQERDASKPLLISSTKTNIGHLEAAAGVAGLIKVALSIYHRTLFPSLHFKKISPLLENKIPHLKIITKLEKFSSDQKMIGSVSSFGFGGTNSHAILSESFADSNSSSRLEKHSNPLPSYAFGGFSSNDKTALLDSLKVLRTHLANQSWEDVQQILKATLSQRMELHEQALFMGTSKEDVLGTIDDLITGNVNSQYRWETKPKLNLRVALLFTGQGSQFTGMFEELYRNQDEFKRSVDSILLRAQKYFPLNLFQVWLDKDLKNELKQTNYSQIILFACEYALAEVLTVSYQLKVDYVFGHSLGEIVAAAISGSMNLNTAIELVCRRGWFMRNTPRGSMLAIFSSLEKTLQILKDSNLSLDLAANNGPDLQIISGQTESIEAIQSILTAAGIRNQLLEVDQAFHSSLMDQIIEPFGESLQSMTFGDPQTTLISSLTGAPLANQSGYSIEYWEHQLRQPTQFEKSMRYLESKDCQIYIEIGPRPILTGMAQKFMSGKNSQWLTLNDLNTFAMGILKLSQLKLFNRDPLITSTSIQLPQTIMKKNAYFISGETMIKKQTSTVDGTLIKLVEIIATTMRVNPDDVNVDESLIDLGADSLVLLNAVQIIKDTYNVSIPISEVFKDLNTLRKIAHFIVDQTPADTTSPAQTQASGTAVPLAPLSMSLDSAPLVLNGDLVSLLNNQLSLMQNQIQLIRNQSQSINTSTASVPPTKSVEAKTEIDSLGSEQRGVLGNFKSFVNKEKTDDDQLAKKMFLQKTITSVTQMTQKTKKHVQTYRKQLADNRVSAGFRPNTKEMIYPIHCYKAKGSQFIDIDGNTFTDFTMGFGVNLFGHSPDFLDQAMKEQFELGVCVGPQSHLAGLVAELFCELTGLERVAFVNSGTEAVMTAIRLARAATGKSKIAIFDGSYHGHFDGVLAKGTKNITSMPVAAGITQNMVNDIIVLEYGNPKSLQVIRERAHELAAVLVEPVQSRFPELQPIEFLKEIRTITEANSIAFIWDEVITGFRIAPGGAQEHFAIKADLAAYGKILGGGMPIGAIGGSSKYLDFIDGGHWEFGNDSYPQNEMTFFAGTFSKHPLAMATAYATLMKLKIEGKTIIQDLNKKSNDLVKALNSVFETRGLDIKVYNFGTLFRFKGSLNLDLLFAKLLEKGFYIWEGRNCFLSTAHTDQDLKLFVEAVKQSCIEIQAAQFYPVVTQTTNSTEAQASKSEIQITPFQKRFLDLEKQGGATANNICVSAKVKGFLDVSKLQQAIEYITERRDIFNWSYSSESGKQFFQSSTKPVDFELINLRSIDRPWKILDKQLNELSKTKFDLEKQSPMLVKVFDVVEETHLMAIVVHHMAFDGWSMTLFFEDLATVYNSLLKNTEPHLRPAFSFQELLQIKQVIPKISEDILLHKYLGKEPNLLFAASQQQPDFSGERIVFDIELKVFEALKRWCKQNKVTPFMLLFAGFAKVLMEEFEKNFLTLAIPAANRDIKGTEVMYGNCANLVPVTLDNSDESILKFVSQVKNRMIEGYQTMSWPYELLKDKTGPLFDVYFNLEPTSDLPEFEDASLLIHPFAISSSEFPLMLNVTDFEHYYHCEIDFQKNQITDDRVLKIVDSLRRKLREELVTRVQSDKVNQS
jgi:acyl transferase domain-containing protein/glutamate-1-semialdehyde aminotransferase